MKKLLHIVDMQNDFVLSNGKLAVAGAESLIEPANEFVKSVHFDKTIATFDTHYRKTYKKTEESKMFPPHCLFGTKGWELAMHMDKYDMVIKVLKEQFDVWENLYLDGVDFILADYKLTPENTDVYVMGVASDFCVKYAIKGYLDRGYSVNVLQDLCRGINKQIDEVVSAFDTTKIKLITSKKMMNQR